MPTGLGRPLIVPIFRGRAGWAHNTERRATSDDGNLERLLGEVGQGGRALVGEATRALVRRFGDRGSCVLVDDRARVVLSTEAPGVSDLHIDLARYPEITAALASHEIV